MAAAGALKVKVAIVVLAIVMAATATHVRKTEAAINCGTVVQALSPCLGYLLSNSGAQPSAGCCSGVQTLYSQTLSSHPDRVTTCGCIKNQASAMGLSANSANAAVLAAVCGVNLGYTMSIDTDCNSIP